MSYIINTLKIKSTSFNTLYLSSPCYCFLPSLFFNKPISTKFPDCDNKDINEIVAEVVYLNADLDKDRIILENRGKPGIYRWTNLVNGNSYVGSAVNLASRRAH